jgi:VanZ family protein
MNPTDQTTRQTEGPDNSMSPIGVMTQRRNDSIIQPLNYSTRSWSRFARYWLPALCWMALIFFLSSLQGSSLSDFGSFDFFVKKGAHVTEYAILYLLLFRAFFTVMTSRKTLIVSAIIGVLYAISDEYHQSFVPLRDGRVRDVAINSIGIFLMYLFLRHRHTRTRK